MTASATETAADTARAIADTLHDAGADLVASLPDTWIAPLIRQFDADNRFRHVPVNREESAVGLCSGAYFTGRPGVALMGASGLLTCIYAITKINYTYQIPMLFLMTIRGALGDNARYHVSNGIYLKSVIDSIDLPYVEVGKPEDIERIAVAYKHATVLNRPYVVGLGQGLLKGVH